MVFTPYITPEESQAFFPEIPFVNSHQMMFWIRDVLVRDTPFTYSAIYELVDELENIDPKLFICGQNTSRKVLGWFKRTGHITLLDGDHRKPCDYVYMWTSYFVRRKEHLRKKAPAKKTILEELEEIWVPDPFTP